MKNNKLKTNNECTERYNILQTHQIKDSNHVNIVEHA